MTRRDCSSGCLGSEPDDNRVIPLPHGPRVHIIGQAPARIAHKPQ